MKETKIVEPKSGLDYVTAHIYNNTKQRLVLTLEQRTEKDVFIWIEGAIAQLKTK